MKLHDSLDEDQNLFIEIYKIKAATVQARKALQKTLDDSRYILFDFYEAEIDRLHDLLEFGRIQPKEPTVGLVERAAVIEDILLNFDEIFSGLEVGTQVHQLIAIPIACVEARYLYVPNLYTKPCRKEDAVAWIKKYAYQGYAIDISAVDDPFVLTEVLKSHLRDLTKPLMDKTFLFSPTYAPGKYNLGLPAAQRKRNIHLLRNKIRKLAPVRRATILALCRHLIAVAANAEKNLMTIPVLARVFGPLMLNW